MALNLKVHDGIIDRPLNMVGAEFYQIYPKHGAYRYIWNICLSVNAMTIAVCASKKLSVPTDGYLGISGKAFDYTIRIPGYDCVEMALTKIEPECIPITLDWRRKPDVHQGWAPQLREWMDFMIWSGFVDLYEKNKNKIHRGEPSVASMAKILRDSCAHGGKITRQKGPDGPVSLDGITIRKEDHGRPISDFFVLGDALVLSIWMLDQ